MHDLLYTHWQAHNFLAPANASAPGARGGAWDGALDFKYAWRHACDDGEQTALSNTYQWTKASRPGRTINITKNGSFMS